MSDFCKGDFEQNGAGFGVGLRRVQWSGFEMVGLLGTPKIAQVKYWSFGVGLGQHAAVGYGPFLEELGEEQRVC